MKNHETELATVYLFNDESAYNEGMIAKNDGQIEEIFYKYFSNYKQQKDWSLVYWFEIFDKFQERKAEIKSCNEEE